MNGNWVGGSSYDQGTAHHQDERRMNAVHRNKSSKFTSVAVQEMMTVQPKTLPDIAKNPMRQFKGKNKMGQPLSPYMKTETVREMSPQEQAMAIYNGTFTPSPPKSGRKPVSFEDANDGSNAQSPLGDVNEASTRSTNNEGRNKEVIPNELTLTYLKTLQKSEDYNRRGYIRTEFQSIQAIHSQWLLFLRMHHNQEDQRWDSEDTETKKRTHWEADEEKARKKIAGLKEHSHRNAKRHEDIRPECSVIEPGRRVHLDPKVVDGCLIELRWRGGMYAGLSALAFDENDQLLGIASPTEAIKGPRNATAVKHYGTNIGSQGSTDSYTCIVGNLPVKASKVFFAVFNTSFPGALLHEMCRAWLTVRLPVHRGPDGESVEFGASIRPDPSPPPAAGAGAPMSPLAKLTKNSPSKLRDHYACGVSQAGPYTALVMASIVKHSSLERSGRSGNVDAWQFCCHNEPFIWAPSPFRLAPILGAGLVDPFKSLDTQVSVAYERLVHTLVIGPWEDLNRRLNVCSEACEWGEIRAAWQEVLDRIEMAASRRQKRKAGRNGGAEKNSAGDVATFMSA